MSTIQGVASTKAIEPFSDGGGGLCRNPQLKRFIL